MKLVLEEAGNVHIDGICDLVNKAYRGEHGWTRETDLVGGDRTNAEQIQAYITDPNTHLLVAIENEEVLSCVCIEQNESSAVIGLFAVQPGLQGSGVGKNILMQAEVYASRKLKSEKFVMVVVSQREELIAYYERRGYVRTGGRQEYPAHLDVGRPLAGGLSVEYLEKKASK